MPACRPGYRVGVGEEPGVFQNVAVEEAAGCLRTQLRLTATDTYRCHARYGIHAQLWKDRYPLHAGNEGNGVLAGCRVRQPVLRVGPSLAHPEPGFVEQNRRQRRREIGSQDLWLVVRKARKFRWPQTSRVVRMVFF